MKKFILTILIALATVYGAAAQDKKTEKEIKRLEKEAQKKDREMVERTLKAYTVCSFDDGLQISRVDRIAKNKLQELGREVAKEDYKGISRTDSYRVMVDYRKPDFFANIRPDRAVPEKYEQDKKVLIQWINYLGILADPKADVAQKIYINDFETYSVNKMAIQGDQIGATVFFDDENSFVVSVYFLNQRSQFRNFQTIEEWKVLRERFLNAYTGCVRENLKNI